MKVIIVLLLVTVALFARSKIEIKMDYLNFIYNFPEQECYANDIGFQSYLYGEYLNGNLVATDIATNMYGTIVVHSYFSSETGELMTELTSTTLDACLAFKRIDKEIQ